MANNSVAGYAPPPGVTDREGVKRLQRQLNAGGAGLAVDGIWGPRTEAAYQARNREDAGESMFGSYMREMESLLGTPALSYTPQSAASLQAQLAGMLRPGVDEAIAERRKATEEYGAALDADAWARGMGRSTYVTDVKNRQMQDEAADIAQLESAYTAALAERLMEAVGAERDRALSAAQYNAEQQAATKKLAFSAAQDAYGEYLSARGTAESSGGGTDGAKATTEENCRKFLSLLTPQQRKNIYDGATEQDRVYRSELIASLGRSGYVAIQQEYPGS